MAQDLVPLVRRGRGVRGNGLGVPWFDAAANRRIWRMAGPIILSNVSVPLLGAVDTAVVGHLPEPYYIGAVAIGAMIFNFIYYGFNCLRMGTTGPTAQAAGAGDLPEVRAMLGRALLLAAVISAVLLVLQRPIAEIAFRLITASEEVETLGRTYFLIRIWAVPGALGTYAVIGWFYGLQDARVPLLLQVFANGVNIVLDFAFVFGLGWDVAGVAVASVIAEYAGFALGLYCIRRRLLGWTDPRPRAAVLDATRLRRVLAVNRDIFIRTMCVVSAFALFMAQSARLGDVPLAANQVLYNFLQVSAFGLDGFAHAAEALVGEAVGRRDRTAFRIAVRTVFLWAALVAALNVALYAAAGIGIVALLTSIPEVRAQAVEFLPWAVAMPAVAVWCYTYDGIFLGATRTRVLRNAMLVSFAAYAAVLFALVPAMGNHGLWLALTLYLGLRGATLAVDYPRLLRSIG